MIRVLAALAVSMWVALCAHAQPIITFAGGGVGEQSPALNALLINPSHLAVDRFNNLHVTDRGGHRILKITPTGVISTVMGTGFPGRMDVPSGFQTITLRKVNGPSGIAFRPTPFNFDPAVDELVFADTGNHWIGAIDTVTATEPVPYVEMGTSFQGYCCDNFDVFADFDTPQGLAVNAAGDVFIADTNNHIVRRVPWHNFTTPPTIHNVAGTPQQAGSTGDGDAALSAKLQSPLAVALDAAGDLYIAESHRIRKVNMSTGIITTLVGSTTAGFNGDGTANASLLLDTPTDLKFGPDGNLYFVDSGNYRVRRIVAGAVQTVAGTGATSDSGDGFAATSAGLAGPRGIVFNADGHLFVTMYDSGKIRRIEAGTNLITTYAGGAVVQPNGGSFAGDGGLARGIAMNGPGGATPLSDGSVYLADGGNHRVRLVNAATGVVSTIAGNGTATSTGDGGAATSATLNSPVSVAVDASGNRYIAEGNRVRKIAPGGTITTFAGGGAASPGDGGLATSALLAHPTWVVARGTDVYIADAVGNRIVKVTAGILTTVAGTGSPGSAGDGGPATAASLNSPVSFVFDAAGNLFIVEVLGHRVRKVTTGGTISTVAGTGTPGFAGDGAPATAAQLNTPVGVAVDDAGALYIVDGSNHRVRKVLPNGTIKTMAGDGNPGFSGDGGDSPGARLNQPSFITRDSAGRLYVTDTDNHRIRRINPRVPFAPTLGTVTPSAGQISIAFTPPADDGNAPIVEYGAECHGASDAGLAGTSSPIVITGLTNGGTYTCFVYARNSAGWGEVSATSAPVTVGTAPSITSVAPPSGTLGVSYSHTYTASGTPASTFTVTAGSLPPGLTLAAGGSLSGTPTSSGVFTGTVTASNGVAPDGTQSFSITIPALIAQAITFGALANKPYPSAPFTVSATGGGSGNPVVFSSLTTGVCTTSGTNGTTVTILAAGPCTIAANQAGNATYTAAPQVTQAFTVTGIFRAYLSKNGSDANPCTLQQPCRLLPAALAAANDRGEIWMLDSANFNVSTVSVAKSVTILAVPGALGSVVANNADALLIDTANVEVTLRNVVVLNLAGAGNTGIRFQQGAQLTIEGCEMYGMGIGVIGMASGAVIAVKDSIIRDMSDSGVVLVGAVLASLDRVALLNNPSFGVAALSGAQALVSDSTISGNGTGASVAAAGVATTRITLNASELAGNGTGVSVNASAPGDTAHAILGDLVITHNGTGVAIAGAGTTAVFSRQNNTLKFNGTDVTGGALTPQAAF